MKARDKFPQPQFPFSNGLLEFMDKDKSFFKSLKLANEKDFKFLGLLSTSHTPASHPRTDDEVIGLWYGDLQNIRSNTKPQFKQDFIVNIKKHDKEFVSYTIKDFVNNGSVKRINEFFLEYGSNGEYYHNGFRWQHHYDTINDLPNEPGLINAAQKLLNTLNPTLAQIV